MRANNCLRVFSLDRALHFVWLLDCGLPFSKLQWFGCVSSKRKSGINLLKMSHSEMTWEFNLYKYLLVS